MNAEEQPRPATAKVQILPERASSLREQCGIVYFTYPRVKNLQGQMVFYGTHVSKTQLQVFSPLRGDQ